jgi:hypothetical protein
MTRLIQPEAQTDTDTGQSVDLLIGAMTLIALVAVFMANLPEALSPGCINPGCM